MLKIIVIFLKRDDNGTDPLWGTGEYIRRKIRALEMNIRQFGSKHHIVYCVQKLEHRAQIAIFFLLMPEWITESTQLRAQ